MNKVLITGRLTKSPEFSENGVCIFTVAVNRNFTNQQGEREADFIRIKTFKKLAENCSKFLKKGSKVGVVAAIRTRSYENNDGKKVFTSDVIAEEVEFLDPKGDTGNQNNPNSGSNNRYQDNRNNQVDDDPFPGGSDYNPAGDGDWPF